MIKTVECDRTLVNVPSMLPQDVHDVYCELNDVLAKHFFGNVKVYIVGGAIRDILLHETPRDYDFVLVGNITLEQMKEYLGDGIIYGKNYPLLQYKGYEITQSPSIEDDIKLRDFTLNACYYNEPNVSSYTLTFPDTFIQDLHQRLLRVNGVAEEIFTKDPLKILRGLRLAAAKNLRIEKETYYEIFRLRHLLKQGEISHERVYGEMKKAFTSHHAYEFVKLLDEFELLEFYFPAIYNLQKIDGGHYHNETVYSHVLGALKALDDTNLPFEVKLSALYHDAGKCKWETLPDGRRRFSNHNTFSAELVEADLSRLKFPRGVKLYVKTIVYHHMAQLDGKKSIFKLKRELDKVKIPLKYFLYIRYADNKACHKNKSNFMDIWRRYKFCLKVLNPKHIPSVLDLDISGRDLILELHINQGKEIGYILRKLFALYQEGEIVNEKEVLLRAAKFLHDEYLSHDDWNMLMEKLDNPEVNTKLLELLKEEPVFCID